MNKHIAISQEELGKLPTHASNAEAWSDPAPLFLSGWLPIEQAPKDGTLMMVSCVRRGGKLHVQKCKWAGHYWTTGVFGNRFADGIVEPTHFFPLVQPE
jgi:hypothetical protein